MKPLLPTLKEKKRYISYEIMSVKPVTGRVIVAELRRILGLFDSAAAGLQSITSEARRGVLRVSTKSVPKVRAALAIIQRINGVPVRITTTGVSGILNKTERFKEEKHHATNATPNDGI